MRRTVIGIAFLCIVALFALWFIAKAGLAIFSYYQLSIQIPVTIEKWSVEEIKSDKFAVTAHYSYEYKEKVYSNQGKVGNLYPNPWAADRAQKQYASTQWKAWLNPKYPEQAVLEKKFPYKKALSAGILICLFIYFSILGTYVSVKTKS